MLVGRKTWQELAKEAGSETKLYVRRLALINKPYEDWDEDDINLAMVCGFDWMQWMQLIRNGQDFSFRPKEKP